jgi:hypothetical protein
MDYSSKVYCQGALLLLRSIWSPYIVQCIDGDERSRSNAQGNSSGTVTTGEESFSRSVKRFACSKQYWHALGGECTTSTTEDRREDAGAGKDVFIAESFAFPCS